MTFRFVVEKTWGSDALNVFHVIGKLEDGKVLSGERALVQGDEGLAVKVAAVVIGQRRGGGAIAPNELTLSLERPSFPLANLEGKVLVSG